MILRHAMSCNGEVEEPRCKDLSDPSVGPRFHLKEYPSRVLRSSFFLTKPEREAYWRAEVPGQRTGYCNAGNLRFATGDGSDPVLPFAYHTFNLISK
jgi:hypothetical protein